jgi:hypothetical protein
VDDGQQRDRAGRRLGASLGRSFERLQLAAVGAVEDLPPARAQLFADCVRGREVLIAPKPDSFGDQVVGFGAVRSSPSWL